SCTMRTARSRTSGEYLGVLALFIMTPFSWKKEPPQNPGRFNIGHDPSSKPTYSDVSVDKLSGQI
ncbi:MAG: hypothetical protein WCY91_06015, partial [Acidithiobacillus sp.]